MANERIFLHIPQNKSLKTTFMQIKFQISNCLNLVLKVICNINNDIIYIIK